MGSETAEFDGVGNGGVELADAVLLAFVVAFEIEAGSFEDQSDAGSGIFQIAGQRRGIGGGAGRFGLVVVGAAPRESGFGVDDPDEALDGEQRERAGVVEDLDERKLGERVAADGIFGEDGGEGFFDAAPFVSLGAEQQDGGGDVALFETGEELGRGHGLRTPPGWR